ncbi:MAG: hypothetical protein FWD57_01580 [Polyangiaceae bacterium]|nr:hypothetical protein [Polyangiaceae bacterium]
MAGKRQYKDWYRYESRKTSWFEAFWMAVFTVALVVGFPVMFAAVYKYGLPLLVGLL